jgi:hypothetical protein
MKVANHNPHSEKSAIKNVQTAGGSLAVTGFWQPQRAALLLFADS